jgi:hypothetical protein
MFRPELRAAVMAASAPAAPPAPLLDMYGCRMIAPRPPSSDHQTVVGGGLATTVDREFEAFNTHCQGFPTQQTWEQDLERRGFHHSYPLFPHEPHSEPSSAQPAFHNRVLNRLPPLISPNVPSTELPSLGDLIGDDTSSATVQTGENPHSFDPSCRGPAYGP